MLAPNVSLLEVIASEGVSLDKDTSAEMMLGNNGRSLELTLVGVTSAVGISPNDKDVVNADSVGVDRSVTDSVGPENNVDSSVMLDSSIEVSASTELAGAISSVIGGNEIAGLLDNTTSEGVANGSEVVSSGVKKEVGASSLVGTGITEESVGWSSAMSDDVEGI